MKVHLPKKLGFLLKPAPYKCAYGGRNGTKSWGFAMALLEMGAARPLRILCARETQTSIKDSVHKLLDDTISRLSLQHMYRVQEATIIGTNGTEIVFAGLKHNINNIKSLEGADIVWVEEAQTVSKASWDKLLPTIRKEGAEVWVSFNPELDTDDTYQRWIVHPPKSAKVVKIGWGDNRWLSSRARAEIEELRERDPEAFDHIYGGMCRSAVEGAVYAAELRQAELNGRFMRVPYDATRPVDTFWDLGYGDMVSIWFAQVIGFEYRIIDYYQNSMKAIDFYIQELQRRSYTYGTLVLPWDGGAKSLGSGKSIEELIRAKGYRTRVLPQNRVADGINAARTIFPQCYFDHERCADGIQGLRHYQWGSPSASGVEKREPLHNAASHPADAFRTMAMHIKIPKAQEIKEIPPRALAPVLRGPYTPFG